MTQTSDAFGSLTALFTSGADSAGDTFADSNGEARAEVAPLAMVLVGNLPVNAGLWTTQMADEVARRAGPTALVRFDRDEVTVELLRADGRTLPPASPDALARWLPRGAAIVRRWVVCVPADAAPGDVLTGGGDVLLMTGADEAAVVHAYHRLKHLSDEATNSGEPLGKIGLAVVGAPDERVDAVAAKLGEAARSFLGIELAIVARLPKLGRVETSARVAYPTSESPTFGEFMRMLNTARKEGGSRFEPRPVRASEPAAHEQEPAPVTAPKLTPAPAAALTPAPAPAPAPALAPALAPAPAPTHVEAKPASRAPASAHASTRLVPFLAGMRPLGISCPTVPEVELALDESGRLQVIGRSDQLARVRAAHTWAAQHQQLLGMAFPELARSFQVLERLVLTDAREAINLHGTGVLLDLLIEVPTPSGPVRTVVALNDASTAG